MHPLRQGLLKTLRDGLLRSFRHLAITRGVAHTRIVGSTGSGAGVVDGVGDFLLDLLGEDLLKLLGDDGGAGGVGGVGSLRHGGFCGGQVCVWVCGCGGWLAWWRGLVRVLRKWVTVVVIGIGFCV